MINKKAAAAVVVMFLSLAAFSAPLFNESLSGTTNGINRLAGGLLPVSFSVNKTSRLQILPEGDDKATLSFSSSYSLSDTYEYNYWDDASGAPTSSWTNSGEKIVTVSREYFNPAGSMSLSLSQKFDDWTYSISLSSRYSNPQERLEGATSTSNSLTFSTLDSSGSWTKKYTDKDAVYAYPWLYGERTNLTAWFSFGASRSIYTIPNLSSFYMSLSFEAGPWWLLNKVSNGGIVLSDYYRASASCSQSMLLKDEEQSISLRWLRISISHSNSISYTFGRTVPQNKLNSFRLRGYISDSVSLSFSGPQMLDSGTSAGMSLSYSSYLYFGGFQNEKSGKSRGLAYTSTLSSSFNLTVFGFISFYYYLSWNTADGYNTIDGLYGSGEVSMSFSL